MGQSSGPDKCLSIGYDYAQFTGSGSLRGLSRGNGLTCLRVKELMI